MKYEIKGEGTGLSHVIETNFTVTSILSQLLSRCKGVEPYASFDRYSFRFKIGNMFSQGDVYTDLKRIMDAYIISNNKVEHIEDKEIVKFAEENNQLNFLKNYKC